MLVVDASLTVDAALAEAGPALFDAQPCVSPPLLWSEVPSSLHELAWRGAVPAERAAEALERFLGFRIDRRGPRRLVSEAWRIADELGWAKTYDAEYVALARILGVPLLTTDARLRSGAARAIEVVGPTEIGG